MIRTLRTCLFVISSYLFHTGNAHIPKIPGSIPTSFKISDGKFACPVKDGLSGGGSTAELKVILCTGSSSHPFTCPGLADPAVHKLDKGKNVTVIEGSNKFFNTYGIAKYFGKETCVSWVYMQTHFHKVAVAECRSQCFRKHLPPRVVLRIELDSAGVSYTEQYYQFEVKAGGVALFTRGAFGIVLILLSSLSVVGILECW